MSAGTAALLLYTYPALVTLAGFLTRRESPTRRTLTALACSAVGMVLLLGLGGLGTGSSTGAALAIGAALTCASYTIAAATVPRSADIFLVMAVLTSAALASLTVFSMATSTPLGLGASPRAWGWIAAFSLVGTVLALVLHQSGLQRLGPRGPRSSPASSPWSPRCPSRSSSASASRSVRSSEAPPSSGLSSSSRAAGAHPGWRACRRSGGPRGTPPPVCRVSGRGASLSRENHGGLSGA